MLPKKDQFRKLVDNQFYQGNVMSVKQTLLINNEPYENEFLQKPPQYHLQYLQLDKTKLQSINPNKESSRSRIRNSSLSYSGTDDQNIIQQLKLKIVQLQSLLSDLFVILKASDNINQYIVSQMHQKYMSIIKNQNEKQSTNTIYIYKQNDQLYGLSTNKIDDDSLSKQTQLIDDKIKEIQLSHYQGLCKQILMITNDGKQFAYGEENPEIQFQQISLNFSEQQTLKSLYFDQGKSNQFTGHFELSQNYSFDSIQAINFIKDSLNEDLILHDINILTYQGDITGVQGIYRNQIGDIEFVLGKPYINSQNLNSEMNDVTYEEERQLQYFEVYQNRKDMTLDKIVLKYNILNKINNTTTKLQMEIGKLKGVNHYIFSNEVKGDKQLMISYSTVNQQNYISKIELI